MGTTRDCCRYIEGLGFREVREGIVCRGVSVVTLPQKSTWPYLGQTWCVGTSEKTEQEVRGAHSANQAVIPIPCQR